MSEIKVNSIKGVGASTAAITVNNTDGTCTANITNNLSNRNLIINGAMQVAQRGTSSTTSGYGTVDRWQVAYGNTDESITQSQVDIASGTTPYSLGFRKALKATNGNQTSGAGGSDYVHLLTKLEAQNIATSGWNYTDSNSFITLSFWVKSSVAQNFYGYIKTYDATYQYPFETGALTANTWTKVTKTIAGNSNLVFNNDIGQGMMITINPYVGTDYTNNSASLNTWVSLNDAARTPDYTSTWYTTNDATFEITGVQLEVGSVATDFEHRSFGQELALCQRYCQKNIVMQAVSYNSSILNMRASLFCEMRAAPTIYKTTADGSSNTTFVFGDMVSISDNSTSTPSITSYSGNQLSVAMSLTGFDNLTQYRVYRHEPQSNLQAICLFDAEL